MKQVTKNAPPIRCRHDRVVSAGDLVQHPANPNEHPPEQIEAYKDVISLNGWRRPVTVSKRSGFVVRGHGALMAAQLMDWPIPVEDQDYATEEEELADLAADNRLSELSKRHKGKLVDLLLRLDNGEFNMRATGYQEDELEDLMAKVRSTEPEFKGEGRAGSASDIANIPISHVRMVQLYLEEGNIAAFLEKVEALQKVFETGNVTDTVVKAVEEVYLSKCVG